MISHPYTSPRPPGVLSRFGYLAGAFGFRELLQTAFFIYLARTRPSTYGEVFLALSLGSIVQFVTELGLNQHLGTLLAGREAVSSLLRQVTLLKGALLALSWLGLVGFTLIRGYSPSLCLVIWGVGLAVGLEALASSFFVALEIMNRQRTEGAIRCAAATGGFLFGFGALFLGLSSAVVALFKLLEAAVNLTGSCLSAIRSVVPDRRSWDLTRVWLTWRGGLIFTVMAAVTMLYNRLNIITLQDVAGEKVLAQYGVAWLLVDGISGLVSELLIRGTLFPVFLVLWRQDRAAFVDRARTAAGALLPTALLLAGALYLESDRIIALLYGAGYGPAVAVLRGLSVCIVLGFTHNLAGYLMIATGRSGRLLAFHAVGLVANLIACHVLIPASPLAGAVAAVVVTKALVAVSSIASCQLGFGLFGGRSTLETAAATATGLLVLAVPWPGMGREAAELIALAPLALVGWRGLRPLLAR
ncbi:MAG: polysaccharide biosynthesis protein [Candidatus Riflebacteria bacterium]|nr:polysaccharide biosynthesis protein [Candidatus Riflebacteria bacterium]